MILTVTLNAALDITYPVAQLIPGATHRVDRPYQRAGGKSVNVARVLHGMARTTLASGMLGGPTGDQMRAELDAAGVPHDFLEIAGETRRTVTVVADESATAFNETGPEVTAEEWSRFTTGFEQMVVAAQVVVCSGSLPPGVPNDAYAVLCRTAAARDRPVIVDATGESLLAALPSRPALIKPNFDELVETTGERDPVRGAARLRERGAQSVVVSLGADGLVAVTPGGSWRAWPPRALTGNPTGAGDAAVAALATGFADDSPWPQRLIAAVAWSAAAVRGRYAGDVDEAVRHEFEDSSTLEEIHATDANR